MEMAGPFHKCIYRLHLRESPFRRESRAGRPRIASGPFQAGRSAGHGMRKHGASPRWRGWRESCLRNYLKTHAGCVAGVSGADARRGDAGDTTEGIVEETQRSKRPAAAATRRDAATSGRRLRRSSSTMLSAASPPPRSLPAARIAGVAARVGSEIVSKPRPRRRLGHSSTRPPNAVRLASRRGELPPRFCRQTPSDRGDKRPEDSMPK